MSEQRNYMAEVQALIDLKWKENPEEMKRVMAESKKTKAKEKQKAEVEKLTKELIEELNKSWDVLDVSKVQDLIKRGVDVKAINDYGETPLHWASRYNRIEIVELLLEKGADVKAKDKWGDTPLDGADSDYMKALLQKYQK